jgi:hypothetical protein
VNLLGSAIPLAHTKAQRQAAHDSRKSVEERYPSRDAYLAAARQVEDALVKDRLLLSDDVPSVMKRIEEQWSVASTKATQ